MAKLVHVILLLAFVCGPAVIRAADTDAPQVPAAPSAVPVVEDATTVIPDNSTTTTTTTTPKTTTESTTTTSTTTTSTTTTTTTTPKTTTAAPTPAPGPVPPPTPNHWSLKNDTKFCLLVDMAIQVNLTYKTEDNAMKTALYDVPANIPTKAGECRANASAILMMWDNDTGVMDLQFKLNSTKKEYQMMFVMTLNIAAGQFPGAVSQTVNLTFVSDAMTPQGMSYHCNRQQMFNATEVIDGNMEKTYMGQVALSKVQWQAFHDRATEGYDLAKDCDAIDTPDIVPIAVGCALAGLVVIVLLGYLVGRHRSQNRGGYLSM